MPAYTLLMVVSVSLMTLYHIMLMPITIDHTDTFATCFNRYKKNLKKLYIVHPTNFIRMMMILLKPLISYKFGRKIAYINRLEELRPVLFLEQVDIPEEVKE